MKTSGLGKFFFEAGPTFFHRLWIRDPLLYLKILIRPRHLTSTELSNIEIVITVTRFASNLITTVSLLCTDWFGAHLDRPVGYAASELVFFLISASNSFKVFPLDISLSSSA